MAIDAYLQIEGIKGESMDDKHREWIECLDVDFGVEQPRSPVTSTAGGHTSARAEFDEILVAKLTDLSTPVLLQHCAMGKTIPKAKFEFFRADGSGERTGRCLGRGTSLGDALVEAARWGFKRPWLAPVLERLPGVHNPNGSSPTSFKRHGAIG